AGCNAVFFGHPWIQASFVYYPWLWLAWHDAWESGSPSARVTAPLLVAAIFFAGNLQSHAYVAIFGLVWTASYAGRTWLEWRRALKITLSAGGVGALLAAPMLFPELELFTLNHRLVAAHGSSISFLDGPLSLSAIYPWTLGTFQTLGYQNLGF